VVRAGRDQVVRAQRRLKYLIRPLDFDRLPAPHAVRTAYQVMLRRDPDPTGFADFAGRLGSGRISPGDVVDAIRGSEEFQNQVRFRAHSLGPSIHAGRAQFIRSLPRASKIVDLGGTHLHRDVGALVGLGYPYPFEELVIVDLPSDERHALYRSGDAYREVPSPLGPVRYRYHSMTDLSDFADSSVDLVYSGQSFEHVPPVEGRTVLKEVFRILRGGGHLALDTPNARVTRLQQEAFIDPDHKVEYTHEELTRELIEIGFQIVDAKGLNYAGQSLAAGRFDADEVAGNSGLHWAIDDCYILCYVCRKLEEP
jgi:SAM-dependent methyltransferase